jgi:hypothetical protein
MRVLSSTEVESLLSNFPNTRLSYEVPVHKNDPQAHTSGYKCFILPKGRRCIAWATEWNQKKVFACIDVVGGKYTSVSPAIRKFQQENGWYPGNIRIFDTCFHSSLVYGTVFSGVVFRMDTSLNPNGGGVVSLFSIHNVYWYKGEPVPPLTLSRHIQLCEKIFAEREIRQVSYTKINSIIFGLPVLCNTDEDAERLIPSLPYDTFAIQYRNNMNTRIFQRIIRSDDDVSNTIHSAPAAAPAPAPAPPGPIVMPKPLPLSYSKSRPLLTRHMFVPPPDEMLTNIQATFIVRPNIQNDIYELFVRPVGRNQTEPVFHNFAHIPNYKTSMMMNRLFRNIRENERLDALEESETEEEFENVDPDKYVSLTTEYTMLCRFHKRFCRWVPVQVVSSSSMSSMSSMSSIITDQQVKQHEIRYLNTRRGGARY